jgi:mannan endo-1,4-beta-mannosidase
MGGNLRTSTFYTEYTDFDVKKGVTEGTAEYNSTIRDIDAIAVQLKRLQNEKIPIIWRPLH